MFFEKKRGDYILSGTSIPKRLQPVSRILCVEARHIYLTPIKETLPYIKNDKNIITVVAGTKDKQLNTVILKEHCIKENICLKLIEGAGHRLEVWGDINKNIELLKEIVAIY